MKLEEFKIINQLRQFLDGTQSVIFKLNAGKSEHYRWIRRELIRFNYQKPLITQRPVSY